MVTPVRGTHTCKQPHLKNSLLIVFVLWWLVESEENVEELPKLREIFPVILCVRLTRGSSEVAPYVHGRKEGDANSSRVQGVQLNGTLLNKIIAQSMQAF